MSQKFYKWLLKSLGWKAGEQLPPEDKCIILGVPHTSIWDFAISYIYYKSIGGKAKCVVKKELFKWPLGPVLRKLGGVPVDRKSASSFVLSIIHAMQSEKVFHLAIAPEGTRKPVRRWKTGFHTIAKQVGCPVYLGYFDWGRKVVGRGQKIELTDDARADMERIQQIYESMNMKGKHPENYLTH